MQHLIPQLFKAFFGILLLVITVNSPLSAQSGFKVGLKYGPFLPGSVFERKYKSINTINLTALKQINKTSDIALSISFIPLENTNNFFKDDFYKYMLNTSIDYKFNYQIEGVERLNLFAKGGAVWNHSKENEFTYSAIIYSSGGISAYNRFGINIGAGTGYQLNKFLGIEISAELTQLFTKEDTMSFGIIQGGLIYTF